MHYLVFKLTIVSNSIAKLKLPHSIYLSILKLSDINFTTFVLFFAPSMLEAVQEVPRVNIAVVSSQNTAS